MARQVGSERSIPHLRDIFGFGGWEEKLGDAGGDSAVSVGSTSEEDSSPLKAKAPETGGGGSNKKKKQRPSRKDSGRTLTERDVKHLERHLSMKKTIRKKIMRDLQQAFVEDPNEFRVEDISPEQLKAEINIQSLSFGGPQKKTAPEPTFLDMLRGHGGGGGKVTINNDDEDSGHGSPTREDDDDNYPSGKKTSFWRRFTIKGRNKR